MPSGGETQTLHLTFPTTGWCPGHGGRDAECCPLWREHVEQTPIGELHIHQARADTEEALRGCPICCPDTAFRRVRPLLGLGPTPGDAWKAAKERRDAEREASKRGREGCKARDARLKTEQGKLF